MADERADQGTGSGGPEPRRGGGPPDPAGASRRGKSYTAEEKRRLVEAFQASKETMRDFCVAHGITTSSLCAWRKAFGKCGAEGLQPKPNPRNRGGKARGAYSAEARRKAVQAFLRSGMTRTAFAQTWGITVNTLSAWVKRYEKEGNAGLDEPYGTGKPRGPRRKPLPPAVKAEITRVLSRFPSFGLKKARDFLRRFRGLKVSPRAVQRTIVEEQIERPTPVKRKHRAPPKVRRFERARPNQLWQTDITSFLLARHHRRVYLTVYLDDHSRYVVAFELATHQRTDLVLAPLREGIARFGKPREVLSDQGRQYFAWRGESKFQRELKREGIRHVVSRSHHPQTLGKTERLWETVGNEFWDRVQPEDLSDARERLAHFFAYYNHFRPHQGIGGLVPADRFFGAADAVRKTIEARLAENELLLAVGEKPRTPVLLYGQVGDRQVSLHGEKGRIVIRTEEGFVREMGIDELGAPSWRGEEDHDDPDDGDEACGGEPAAGQAEADAPLQEAGALPESAADAFAGAIALEGGERGGEEKGARDVRGDAGALAGEDRAGRGGAEAAGQPAPSLAAEPAGAGGDGRGALEAAEAEEADCGGLGRRADDSEETDHASGEGALPVAGPPAAVAGASGAPGEQTPVAGGEGCAQAEVEGEGSTPSCDGGSASSSGAARLDTGSESASQEPSA
jgi:transposase InsO family protein